ncbi:hypothetical protein FOLKNPGA_00752 [Legionella sp. PC1000]|nr:hypothetical protein FOLKNPGA_00752 [Legionella sp. PC1000]
MKTKIVNFLDEEHKINLLSLYPYIPISLYPYIMIHGGLVIELMKN